MMPFCMILLSMKSSSKFVLVLSGGRFRSITEPALI